MLNNNRDKIEKAVGTFENPVSPTKSYNAGSHPAELYVKGDRGYCDDALSDNAMWLASYISLG